MSKSKSFEHWFAKSKYVQVVFPEHHWYQIAKDSWEAAIDCALEKARNTSTPGSPTLLREVIMHELRQLKSSPPTGT